MSVANTKRQGNSSEDRMQIVCAMIAEMVKQQGIEARENMAKEVVAGQDMPTIDTVASNYRIELDREGREAHRIYQEKQMPLKDINHVIEKRNEQLAKEEKGKKERHEGFSH